LGRKDVFKQWLLDRCKEVEKDPNNMLDLWARGHYKSTIITFAKTIQDILASHGSDPIYDKELTFGIFSFKRPIATQFLSQIKRELESNELLKSIFPDILFENPKRESKKWSDEGIIVKRKSNPKEATIEAWGVVEGQPTSKHFDVLIYDDVVTIENVRSKEMITKTNHAWELSLNLGAKNAWFRYIGTRYHYDDTYSLIMRRGVAKPRIHPAEDKEGNPVFLTRDELDSKKSKMGLYVYNCQMIQNPVQAENQVFDINWLSSQYFTYTHHDNMNVYIVVDNASSKKENADYTVMWVIGLAQDNNYYVLDCIRDRLSLTERADSLFRLHRKWKPLHVGYERYGVQADIEYLQERMNAFNYHFHVVELGGRLSKEDRIKKLVPYFQQKRIYLPDSLFYTTIEGKLVDLISIFIEEEYKRFPFSSHDDMLDSLARIVDDQMETYWPELMNDSLQSDRYTKKHKKSDWSQWSA
jgi:predicted phage terminase large subunit-like protein